MAAVITKTIEELQKQIEELQREIKVLKDSNSSNITERLARLEARVTDIDNNLRGHVEVYNNHIRSTHM